MKRTIGIFLMAAAAQLSQGQTNSARPSSSENIDLVCEAPSDNYVVFDGTTAQETALRMLIRQMHPDVLPQRVFFVPHWKYLYSARMFQLRVPTGYASVMFTHLASRTVFIDNDRYQGEQWLGHWIAHELGHMVSNSVKEEDAERAAREFRKRLRESQNQAPTSRN